MFNIQDNAQTVGALTIQVVDSKGKLKDFRELKNLIVQVGKNYLTNAVIAAATTPFTHIALGTNSTAAALADTILGTEISRATFTSVVNTNTVTLTATFAAGTSTGAITEAGIFNNAIGGTMLSHVVFSVINKASTDTLTVTWNITIG